MELFKAVTKSARISPRKARLAAGLIRGKQVEEAQYQLEYSGLKAGDLLMKTLNSAIANAEFQSDARKEKLFVEEVRVDEGPRMKRQKPRSRGRTHPFIKRTSHFTVIVGMR
jgi:large subunit ribosomal protein L22